MAGRVSDWYFANGNTPEGISEQINDVTDVATVHGRKVRFGLNGFFIGRDTETEARDVLREIVDKADREAVEGFGAAVKQAGQSTGDKKGMWQDSEFADLVQYNDGFRTGLIGTPEQIATRIIEYKKRGVNLFLLGFLHYLEDVEYFGREVLPLVREPGGRGAWSGSDDRRGTPSPHRRVRRRCRRRAGGALCGGVGAARPGAPAAGRRGRGALRLRPAGDHRPGRVRRSRARCRGAHRGGAAGRDRRPERRADPAQPLGLRQRARRAGHRGAEVLPARGGARRQEVRQRAVGGQERPRARARHHPATRPRACRQAGCWTARRATRRAPTSRTGSPCWPTRARAVRSSSPGSSAMPTG
ncbi:LLM class flavin-dependent oxidoreductase [Nocardioides convexus]|uniref:LLM class flavin-dependent oxidoreductase n=1 Tax=Nocardioides convexus TaxID=2712224 RepID=UPI0024185C62|nr:LLM class flavin-dependent oxidoreductase [Nocardioides convexus]